MKEIVAEYPLERVCSQKPIFLYRFESISKPFKPVEIKYKPLSGYTEISFQFPSKNVSALKLKTLDSSNIVFKAFPENPSNYYLAKIANGKITLQEIKSLYLFEPVHQYYSIESQKLKLKKAESREELEHRKKSINYKLRMLEQEDFRVIDYDGDIAPEEPLVRAEEESTQHSSTSNKKTVDFKKIEETIKNTRIVNFERLVEIFGNKGAVTSVLYKMTEGLCGRFVLKSSYYEKRLWDMREKMLQLFKRNGVANISDTTFLGDEQWMAEEICNIDGRKYVLKGFKESVEFDANAIYNSNKNLVKQVLLTDRMQNTRIISEKISIDEEIVSNIVKNSDFIHLVNNCYAMNDEGYWFTGGLKLFEARKTVDITEVTAAIESSGISKTQEEIMAELKFYCNHRGTKYTIKSVKE